MLHPTPKSRRSATVAVHTSHSKSWELPDGQTLAEFALRSGILAATLLIDSKPTRRQGAVSTSSAGGARP